MNATLSGVRARVLETISQFTDSSSRTSMLPTSLSTNGSATHKKKKRSSLDRPRLFTKNSVLIPSSDSRTNAKYLEDAVPSRSTLLFVLGCLAWYTSSSLSSNTSKSLLSKTKNTDPYLPPTTPPVFPYPVTLTLIHFGFVNACCAICASRRILGRHAMTRLVKPSFSRVAEVGQLAIFNVLGQALSSLAISRVPVSTVHTIKALSPLFTVLSYTFIFNVTYSSQTYASLLPLTLGVMMACTGFAFNADDIVGFGAALLSTFVFVAQNIYSKKLLRKGEKNAGVPGTDSEKMDKINILFYSSACSFVLMIPMALYYDGGSLMSHPAWSVTDQYPQGRGSLVLWLLLCNGLVHFAQNILAFNVLSMVSPVTYSIASLLKRVFVIVLAILWFHQTVTLLQWIGIIMTFYGLYMYNDSKTKDDVNKGEKQISRKQDTVSNDSILPLTGSSSMNNRAAIHSNNGGVHIRQHVNNSDQLPPLMTNTTKPYHFAAQQPPQASRAPLAPPPRNLGGWNDVPASMFASDRSYIQDPTKSLPSPPDSDKEGS